MTTVPPPSTLLFVLIGIAILLVAMVSYRPLLTTSRGGKELAFVALFLFPLGVAWMGASEHMERSKTTEFCLSCHTMEPYGKSLLIDDASFLPASHYQNARVPRDHACYTCHTDYVLYGSVLAKMRGLRHVWAQYVTTPAEPLHLYTPYNNRECLHCHAGARSFEEGVVHVAVMEMIKSNELSCLSSGCHSGVHNVSELDQVSFWEEPK